MSVLNLFLLLIIFVIPTLISATTECTKEGSSRSQSLKIKNKILCKYDKEYRPRIDQSKTVNVTTRFILRSISRLDEDDHTLSVQNWLGVGWDDEFLRWNPEEYDNVQSIRLSHEELWMPDLKIVDEKSSVLSATDCLVNSKGAITCVIESVEHARCTHKLKDWPYDTQICKLTYTTGVHNVSQVQLITSKKQVSFGEYEKSNSEWEILRIGYLLNRTQVKDELFSELSYTFTVKRHSARVVATIFVPALSLIVMSLVPLWLKPSSANTERFSLVCANIFSHLLFTQHMSWTVTFNGPDVPPPVTFFRDSTIISVIVLIELSLVNTLLGKKTTSPPSWILTPCKFVSSGVFGRGLLIEEPQVVKEEENSSQMVEEKQIKIKENLREKILIVTVIDRLCFVILFIVYFVMLFTLIPI